MVKAHDSDYYFTVVVTRNLLPFLFRKTFLINSYQFFFSLIANICHQMICYNYHFQYEIIFYFYILSMFC